MKVINLATIDFAGGGSAPTPPVPPGPTPSVPAKDVNFRDYDGSIVASYTKAEFAALTALPANPTHEGLTGQGWNWTLANAQAYVAKYGRLEVGQMYITSDGKTRIYINLNEDLSPYLGLGINGSVSIDWGDGSTPDTMTGSDADQYIKRQHVYNNPGAYIIEVTPAEGTEIHLLGEPNSRGGLIVGADSSDSSHYIWLIERVNIGRGVTSIGSAAFYECYSLHSISIPDSVTSIGSAAFYECYSLATITVAATTPPYLADAFWWIPLYAVIYVPAESVDAYKAATNWGQFPFMIKPMPE